MILPEDTANHVAFLPQSSEVSWMPAPGRQIFLLYQLFTRQAYPLFSLDCLSILGAWHCLHGAQGGLRLHGACPLNLRGT